MWLGDVSTLRAILAGVDTVVSLRRIHDEDLPVRVEQIDIRLIDDGPEANLNLDFVLTDTVRLIEQLPSEVCTVLLHCGSCSEQDADRRGAVRRTQAAHQR